MRARHAAAAIILAAIIAVPVAASAMRDNRVMFGAFVDMFYARRDVKGAFERFVSPDYIQHNPGLPDGREVAVAALAPMFGSAGARFDVKHVLVDGDLALVHLMGRGDPKTRGAAVADLYRIRGGRVVEHWDVIQPIAEGSDPLASRGTHRRGPTETARNRRVMQRFATLLFARKQVAAAFDAHAAPDMIQHNARLGQGRAGAIAALTPLFAKPGASFAVKRILVDGNMAAIHYHGRQSADNPGAAVVELFRLERGRIVEHWDVFQPVPVTTRNPHPMF